jgi:hypothetical protein
LIINAYPPASTCSRIESLSPLAAIIYQLSISMGTSALLSLPSKHPALREHHGGRTAKRRSAFRGHTVDRASAHGSWRNADIAFISQRNGHHYHCGPVVIHSE